MKILYFIKILIFYFKNKKPLNDETQLGANNVKKINKLVWNPEKLEIEYKEEDHQQQIQDQSDSNSKQLNTSSELVKQQQNITDVIYFVIKNI